ncbi:class A sortase [Liquorilactobacillus sicerae]|uniref:class A sortase n=1 Tax=Liquorilactobacillus sicerae TaxID=1416943 RepID=UPI002480F276|nr:class A sortase [Liquorilactobacillus sicerae]
MNKKNLRYFFAAVLLVIGLVLVFNQQLTSMMVNQMTSQALKNPIRKTQSQKGEFNFKKIKSASAIAVVKAKFLQSSTGSIGKIAVPAVKLKLPIFYGITNDNLLRGAGTLKADQKMGQGNYALAGHHMNDPNILFSPLAKAKVGEMVYLTDGRKVYQYRLTLRKTISKYQVNVINDVPKQKLLTLITCDPIKGVAHTPLRIFLQGKLVATRTATAANLKIFE